MFEVTELCRTRADILKPTLDRTRVASQITNINKILNEEVLTLTDVGRKRVNLYLVNLPKDRFQSNHSFLNLIVSRR